VEHPLTVSSSSYIHGQIVPVSPSSVSTQALTQSFSLPIATFIVVVFAMQIAATAIAVEKEQKTLETLLTLPVSRFKILASKLVGSTIIAGLGAVASLTGFAYYMTSITSLSGGGGNVAYVFSPPLAYYAFTGVLIFLTLTLATLVAIVISAFAQDVRSAQALVGYLSLPIMLPAFFVLFGDFNSLPADLRLGLLAVPFSYVAAFTSTGIAGDFALGVVGVGYIAAWILVLLYLAAWFFRSERILTAKLSFRRKKQVPIG
jgi:ABC-2 type transport system permease protein